MIGRWDIFELTAQGPQSGNPFTGPQLKGVFRSSQEEKTVSGFYDGEGRFVIRFMPSFEGEYTYRVEGDFLPEPLQGTFFVGSPSEGSHGPVRVRNRYHFAYEDGKPYYSVGTTCYVWELQDDVMVEKTLETLSKGTFNKIRFCIFPKHYAYNLHEPRSYPYKGTPMDSSVLTKANFFAYGPDSAGNQWDYTAFNPEHFRHIEKCIAALRDRNIEADLILFHPYDRWGFSAMSREDDERYLEYVIARFAAFRNVWWSLANEYDLIRSKTKEDWEHIGSFIRSKDPYGHLRSIHNCMPFYDHSAPWITHASIQRQDIYKTAELTGEWRERWQKPVVLDEIAYEGTIQYGWGDLTGEEMLRRFWEAACRGGYPGHGETIPDENEKLWWSHGGELHGESWKRFRFLREIMEMTPGIGLRTSDMQQWDDVVAEPEEEKYRGSYYLCYYSFMRPSFREFRFDNGTVYKAYVIDTWNMTREYAGTFSGSFIVPLKARQYMAVQLIAEGEYRRPMPLRFPKPTES